MSDPDTEHRHAVALFRYGLIAELIHLEPGSGLYQRIREKADAEHTIPGSTRTRVAAETIRDWLKRYRAGGFDALMPKLRADRQVKKEKTAKSTKSRDSRQQRQAARAKKKDLARLKRKADEMQTELESQEARLAELETLMSTPGFFDDRAAADEVVTEHKQLQMLIGAGYEDLEAALEAVEKAGG